MAPGPVMTGLAVAPSRMNFGRVHNGSGELKWAAPARSDKRGFWGLISGVAPIHPACVAGNVRVGRLLGLVLGAQSARRLGAGEAGPGMTDERIAELEPLAHPL